MMNEGTKKIFISALEPSADSHCAGLIKAIHKAKGNIEFTGQGGPKMAAAGCSLIEETKSTVDRAVMTYNTFTHLAHYHKLIKQTTSFIAINRPDLVIVCDSPAFNFHIAKAAKKLGIKTLFYVAPQLWAWAAWRINKMRKCCDKLCCILPFEEQWFASRGIATEFVGNPLLDELSSTDLNNAKRDFKNFNSANARIALIPGSRTAEVGTLWRPMQQIAIELHKKYPKATFTTVAVDEKTRGALDSTRLLGFRTSYVIDAVYKTARESDFALVASGSATLQVASAGCPMVIMYKTSRALWHLVGRWLVTTRYLSLVNILAERQQMTEDRGQKTEGRVEIRHPSSVIRLPLVPEFMPYFRSIEPIIETIIQQLNDKTHLAQINSELLSLVRPLTAKKAGAEVAKIAISMLG